MRELQETLEARDAELDAMVSRKNKEIQVLKWQTTIADSQKHEYEQRAAHSEREARE